MNINNILMISYVSWDWLKIQQLNQLNIAVWLCCLKRFFVVFTASRFPYVILCPNLITVRASKGKTPHTYKELIRYDVRVWKAAAIKVITK